MPDFDVDDPLLRLDEPAYGVTILGELEERTGRTVSPGAIYTAMSRLERRGLVSSFLGEPTPQRGGRRKRFYELEAAGRAAIAEREAHRRALAPASSEP